MGPKVGMPEGNYEEKTICCLVLDDSWSMNGEPIRQLNKALQEFYDDIQNDIKLSSGLEIAIVKFGEGSEVIQEPSLVSNISMPTLQANDGGTALNAGVREAIRLVEERKSEYKQTNQSYKRPWIVPISDGAPTDGNVDSLAQEIEEDTKQGKYVLLPIGVDGADMNTLNKIAGFVNTKEGTGEKMSALAMDSANFSEFFEWLSQSMSMVYNSQDGAQLSLPAPTWMKGFVA